MHYETLAAFIAATAALALTPGPDNLYVLSQSLVYGARYGIAVIMGLLTGCLVHTALLAFGVSAIIRGNESLYLGIKTLGALYLIWLAYQAYRKPVRKYQLEGQLPKLSYASLFKQGFVMNVLNPKVTLFFLAFFPGFIFSDKINTVLQFLVLGFLFITVSFIVFCGIALLAGFLTKRMTENLAVGLWLKRLQIFVFIGIALYLTLM